MNHIPRAVPAVGKSSEAYWSPNPDGRIAIFVHGFGGDGRTWSEFETYLPKDPRAAGADLLFFGYEGIKGHIALSANVLYRLLETIGNSPSDLPSFPEERSARFRYHSITIVAHSMGAIVSRRALLLAVKARDSWVRKARLVLFAPAHAGVRLTNLLKECGDLMTKVGVLSGFGKALSPAFDDLSKPDTFKKLTDETRSVLRTPFGAAFRAKRVVFGDAERVVLVEDFCEDPASPHPHYVVIVGKDHKTVCKPNHLYSDPVDIVAEVL